MFIVLPNRFHKSDSRRIFAVEVFEQIIVGIFQMLLRSRAVFTRRDRVRSRGLHQRVFCKIGERLMMKLEQIVCSTSFSIVPTARIPSPLDARTGETIT